MVVEGERVVVEGERVKRNFVGTPKMMCQHAVNLKSQRLSHGHGRTMCLSVILFRFILGCSLGSRLGVIDGLCGQHGFFYPSEIFFFSAAGQQKSGHQFSFQVLYSHDRDAADNVMDG